MPGNLDVRRGATAPSTAGGSAGDTVGSRRPERPATFLLFFVAAAVFAVLAVPLWTAVSMGLWPLPLPAYWHGHEMVFGFALAVVGGYLLTGPSRPAALLVFAAWLGGRAAPFMPGLAGVPLALAYPLALFLLAGMPFLRAAKSLDNAVFGPVVGAFLVAEVIFQLGALGVVRLGEEIGLVLAIDLLALLMFAMGGRIIAAATSGALRRQGMPIRGAAQARLERIGVVALIAMTALDAWPPMGPASGALAAGAGAIAFVRLARWRIWRVSGLWEVSALHLGYLWLGAALAAKGLVQIASPGLVFEALHALAVGAFGVLATTMMVRASAQRSRRPIARPAGAAAAVVLVALAAALRLAAPIAEEPTVLLAAAAALWAFAFAMVAGLLLAMAGPPASRRPPDRP